MKEFLCVLFILFCAHFVRGQDITSSIVFQGGYNFVEKEKVTDIAFVGEFVFFMLKLEIPVPFSNRETESTEPLCYCAPSFGVFTGEIVKGYFLFGVTPLRTMEIVKEKEIYGSIWHPKLECGVNVYLFNNFFLNSELVYVFPYKSTDLTKYSNYLALKLGLGLTF